MSPTRPDAAGLRIRLLGPLEATVDGRPIRVDTRKALAILALLAAERRPFARDELAALLWPEADDESARGALRRTLSVLRAALGDRWVSVSRAIVTLEIDDDRIDLRLVEAAASSAEPSVLHTAADAARGPFLAGFTLRDSPEFDDWRAARATAVERSVATVLDRLAEQAAAAGDLPTALAAAARRLDLDPLDEEAHRRLMRLHARNGDRAAAVRQYRACVAVLERELGVAPLAETTELYEAIRDRPAGPQPVASAGPPHTSASPAPAIGLVARPTGLPLVGREAERSAICAALASPAGRVVVVTGEAGIGKTRLLEEVLQGRPAEARALVSRAYAAESGIAYAPIVELLRAGFGLPEAVARLANLPTRRLLEIERLVELPAALGRTGRGTPDVPLPDPVARARLIEAVADVLEALVAGPEPGLVAVEDAQWLDDASRALLAWLARRLAGRSFSLLLTWRPEDFEPEGISFAQTISEVPGAVDVRLGRLDATAVGELVRAAGPAGPDAPPLEQVVTESEGLPLFVLETLLARQPSGHVAPNPLATDGGGRAGAARRTIHALIRDRLAAIGEPAAQIAATASVIGRSFDLALVRGASGRSEDETITALEELIRRGIVRELEAGRGEGFDFAHAAFRHAAYEATSLARRRLLHRRVADLLRADGSGRDLAGRLAQVAAHEQAAGRDAEAADAYRDAGLAARRVFATREAIAYLETALALGHRDLVGIQVALGELRTAAGDYAGAIVALEAAAALEDAVRLPAIELRLGRVHALRGDPPTARSHLDAAIEALEPGLTDPRTLARALVERARVALDEDDLALAKTSAGRALAIADGHEDPALASAAERMLGLAALAGAKAATPARGSLATAHGSAATPARGSAATPARGSLATAREHLERSVELAAGDPDPGAAVAAGNALALVEAAAGNGDAAIATLETALDVCRRTGSLHLEAAIENNLADQLHAAGRTDEAMVHLKRAVALFAEVGGRPGELQPEIWKLVSW
jgi:DNA-binding SARP family transcriptional activator